VECADQAGQARQAPLGPISPSAIALAAAFTRYVGVGVGGLVVDASVFTLLDHFIATPALSRAVSLGLATPTTWRLNRRFTFGASGRRELSELLRYGTVTLIAQGTSYGLFLALLHGAPALPRLLSLLIGAAVGALIGFTGHKLVSFARPRRGRLPLSPKAAPQT
jgi:putative flippase GtrA